MRTTTREGITIGGRRVEYRCVRSKSARKLRIRVGVNGIEVLRPFSRAEKEVTKFLRANRNWLFGQLARVERFQGIRKPRHHVAGEMLFRGRPTRLRVERDLQRHGPNRVFCNQNEIVVIFGQYGTAPAKSLENWLRREARAEIAKHLNDLTASLKRIPRRVYIMNQRTKWGNCSSKQNLSFNWRLILAPTFVLRYLVTHEAVHLAVPDHSKKFWLTVKSLCPEAEQARQWLARNTANLLVDLSCLCKC